MAPSAPNLTDWLLRVPCVWLAAPPTFLEGDWDSTSLAALVFHSWKVFVKRKVRNISMSITRSSIIWVAKGLLGETLRREKSLPLKADARPWSSRPRLFSFSVKTSLISSRGREERCATDSSVAKNILRISSSKFINFSGDLIAWVHILLNGPVIRIETVLVGDLYRMTFWENLTALVNSNESS